jgi:tRNA U38,U39,U40 pseudouridine synthase TruA
MRNVALQIEYDGTDFVGSQWQNNGRSVQGELEGAWEQLTQERRRIWPVGLMQVFMRADRLPTCAPRRNWILRRSNAA